MQIDLAHLNPSRGVPRLGLGCLVRVRVVGADQAAFLFQLGHIAARTKDGGVVAVIGMAADAVDDAVILVIGFRIRFLAANHPLREIQPNFLELLAGGEGGVHLGGECLEAVAGELRLRVQTRPRIDEVAEFIFSFLRVSFHSFPFSFRTLPWPDPP